MTSTFLKNDCFRILRPKFKILKKHRIFKLWELFVNEQKVSTKEKLSNNFAKKLNIYTGDGGKNVLLVTISKIYIS